MKVGQNQVNRKGVFIIVKGFFSRYNLSETRRGVKFWLTHSPSLANTNLNVVLKFLIFIEKSYSFMDIDPCEEQFPFKEDMMEEHDDVSVFIIILFTNHGSSGSITFITIWLYNKVQYKNTSFQ